MISLPGGAIIGLILAIIIIIIGALLISNIVNFAKSQDDVLAESYFEALAQAIDRACNTGEAEQTVWLPEGYIISISDHEGCDDGTVYFGIPCVINGTSYENKTICLVKYYKVIACYYLPKHLSDCEENYTIEKAEFLGSLSSFIIWSGGPKKVIIKRKGNVLEFRY